jgi:hypothetical protein
VNYCENEGYARPFYRGQGGSTAALSVRDLYLHRYFSASPVISCLTFFGSGKLSGLYLILKEHNRPTKLFLATTLSLPALAGIMVPAPLTLDFYAILELTQTATHDEIKTSYRRLALKHHPDRDAASGNATRRMQHVCEEYRVSSVVVFY